MAGPSVVVEMTGSEARLFRAQQRIIQQQVAMEAGYRKVGSSSRQAGDEGSRAGKQATSGWVTGPLKNFAAVLGGVTGGLSVAAAFRGVVNIAREAQQEIRGLSEELGETIEGMKYLWQVSEGQRGYEQLAGRYKVAMAQEGIGREAAQDLVFQLKSFDEMEAFDAVIKSKRFMKPEVAAEYIGGIRSPVAWGKQIATPEQALAGILAGAEKSKFNVDVTAMWFARTAAQARSMGATPAEVLGAGAAVAPAFSGPRAGQLQATAMRGLISDLATWRDEKLLAVIKEKPEKPGLDRQADARYAEVVRKAETIRATKGLFATFDLYRQMEPLAYQERKTTKEFRLIAEAMEGAEGKAKLLTAEIQKQFTTGEAFRAKIAERPPELTIQQQFEKAKAQKAVALEPLALKQTQLETLIEQSKALAGVTGTPITIEKLWERALQGEATIGLVDEATQQVASRLLNRIRETSPEVAEQFLHPVFRQRALQPSGLALDPYQMAVGRRQPLQEFVAPAQLLPRQTQAIQDAMTEILGVEIAERPGRRRAEEERNERRQDAQAFRQFAQMETAGMSASAIAAYLPTRQAEPAIAAAGDLTVSEAARDLSRAAQDLQPAVDGLNRLVDRIGARDPLLGVGLGEDR